MTTSRGLTDLERRILRDVLDDTRTSANEVNQREHDQALVGLVKRGLIRYNPERQRQKFTLTYPGRAELNAAEKIVNGTSLEVVHG